jgi:hypothetical protein
LLFLRVLRGEELYSSTMTALESLLLALFSALAQAFAQAIVPAVIQQAQQPSTAQDGFADPDLQKRVQDAIENPISTD